MKPTLGLFAMAALLAATCGIAEPYKILGLFPHPGLSHFYFFEPILKGLAAAGHEVTVVSPFPNPNPPPNYTDLPLEGIKLLSDSVSFELFDNRPSFSHFVEFFMLYDWGKQACEHAYSSPAIKQVLESKVQYDLVLVEQFNNDCMLGIAHLLNAPYIGLSSCPLMPWHYDRVGNPMTPSYIPALFMGYSEKMSFTQRLSNWITAYSFKAMYSWFNDNAANAIIRKHLGNNIPDIKDLQKRTSMMFVNQHHSLSGPKPLSPAVVEIGGIHIQEFKELDPTLKQLLDTADHGVIYISWGSMIRSDSLPEEKRNALLAALGSFKQRVIWKWENETLPNQPSNVFIRKWLPQREILCHPKVRVFMSHGGLLGSSETAYCGVPVVVTPMYGDQYNNAAALEHRGMGVVLPYEQITRESVYEALKKALEPVKMENAKRVSFSYRNRPQTAVDTAVWWSEHVVATGGLPLAKTYATEMPWYSYHVLDLQVVIYTFLTVYISCWVWLFKRVCCRGVSGFSDEKVKTN
ncbi:UDP-glycosyltransferase UGT5-like [Toxorhynchites rutilus septentrionalis]|uniref:UDP-glycosyltransferase UGT5-like n=1 Tax=Toxorhynchites rutilus septentrionalis TaxID=329112 RepID=UPI0024791861|nr:UDP-glycosyltransferase UGT5-like [Toxorhynchites rutilus septentrionalis]XP_055635696.1 UDP-glycosyltransferase UGT5-like [Toxorhynchites rutilus septentrionalis]XP_055635697.1 UDP-glycosyltransferase UGT5-like [Toxorhynchites rutilus septentrionalis]XP_055635698.1 UDP-glycosyltransferase UGT5-like [Toxorhynchites rutilus septentrionalis]